MSCIYRISRLGNAALLRLTRVPLSDDHVEVGLSGSLSKRSVVAIVNSPMCVVKSYAVDNFQLMMFDPNTA